MFMNVVSIIILIYYSILPHIKMYISHLNLTKTKVFFCFESKSEFLFNFLFVGYFARVVL